MQFVSGRIGRLITGDTPLSPMQNPTGAARGMGEQGFPQPLEEMSRGLGPQVREGMSMADRPRVRQVGCETCGQIMEDFERKAKCQVCSFWTHDACFEKLCIGSMWYAEMCLTCHQKTTRKLRVISKIERKKGQPWNQDRWFKQFFNLIRTGGHGATRNKDLNELEISLAKAVMNGLRYYRDA